MALRDSVVGRAGWRWSVALSVASFVVLAGACGSADPTATPATPSPVPLVPAPTPPTGPFPVPALPTVGPVTAMNPTPMPTPPPGSAAAEAVTPTPMRFPPPTWIVVTPVPTTPPATDAYAPPDPVEGVGAVTQLMLGSREFRLEVARTPEERAIGLMGRTSLAPDAAMLFVFEDESPLEFWMKGTLIPLDLLFLNADGVVVDIHTMHPQAGVPDRSLRRYSSAVPARYAIEINAGLAEAYRFQTGDQALVR